MSDVETRVRPVRWVGDDAGGALEMLDQRELPGAEVWEPMRTVEEVAEGIRAMKVRGAPAIGIAAAFGLALGAREHGAATDAMFEQLAATRPTAVNLFWALERMRPLRDAGYDRLLAEARAIMAEDAANNLRMGRLGAELFRPNTRVLTHCNTGGLATGGYGTALGIIRALHAAGKLETVWVDETRPYLQGARLTMWELTQDEIPCTLITDNMAGYFMKSGQVDAVIVGTDRVAANGDIANKIGTYSLAVLCKHHGVDFYVAAPRSTIDLATSHGDDIEIEQRAAREVTHVQGVEIAPAGVRAAHPAFDVTPAELITAIITEDGVATAPYEAALRQLGQSG